MATNKKYLFAIDLDGTLLSNSATSEIHPDTVKSIKKLREQGHIVCIATGRPWRASEKAYKQLGLDTVIANYNGAQIHNPSDYDFTQHISYMNLTDVLYILGDEKLKAAKSNLAIEGPGWVQLEKRDEDLERVFGFDGAAKFRVGIDIHKIPLKPTGIIFDTKPGVNIRQLKEHLQRRYGDLAEFSSWSKGEGLTPVFDMTNIGITKAKAISLIARYYDIDMVNTVAIGDGYNDVPMFDVSEISAAMANSSEDIKALTTYVTTKTNKEGGVGEVIDLFLNDKDGSFIKEQRAKRRKLKKFAEEITVAH